MRFFLTVAFILTTTAICNAQVQERKLIDRLLKPDASLENSAQGKEFVASGTVATKKAATKSFYVADRSPEKTYTNVRNAQVKDFPAQTSPLAQQKASTASRTKFDQNRAQYATATYEAGEAADATRRVEVSDYSGTRPFLVQGKSQKALSAQHPPLTVEEVRELLNKNK